MYPKYYKYSVNIVLLLLLTNWATMAILSIFVILLKCSTFEGDFFVFFMGKINTKLSILAIKFLIQNRLKHTKPIFNAKKIFWHIFILLVIYKNGVMLA